MYTWIKLFFAFLQVPSVAPIPYQPRLFGFRIHNRHSIIKIKLENVGQIVLHSVCCLYATNNRYSLVCFFYLFLHIHFLLLLYIYIYIYMYTYLYICIYLFIYCIYLLMCLQTVAGVYQRVLGVGCLWFSVQQKTAALFGCAWGV